MSGILPYSAPSYPITPSNKRWNPTPTEEGPNKKQKTCSYHEVIITGLAYSNWGEEIPKISLDPPDQRLSTIIEYLQRCFEDKSLVQESLAVTLKCYKYYKQLGAETQKIYEVAYQSLIKLPVAYISFNNNQNAVLSRDYIHKLAEISDFFESNKNSQELSMDISHDELELLFELLKNKQKEKEFLDEFKFTGLNINVSTENLKLLKIILSFKIKENLGSEALELLIRQVRDQISKLYDNLNSTSDLPKLFTCGGPSYTRLGEKLVEIDDQISSKAKQAEYELLFAEVKAFLIGSKTTKKFDFETNKLTLLKLIENFTVENFFDPTQLAKRKLLMQTVIEVLLTDLWTNSTSQPEINEQVNKHIDDLLELCKPLNLKYFKLKGDSCFTLSLEQMEKVEKKCSSRELTVSQYKENEQLYKQIFEIPNLTIDQFDLFTTLLINPSKMYLASYLTSPTANSTDLKHCEDLLSCAKMFECKDLINKIGIKMSNNAKIYMCSTHEEKLFEIAACIKSKIYDKIPDHFPLRTALSNLFGLCPFDKKLIEYFNKGEFNALSLSKIPQEIKNLKKLKILTISSSCYKLTGIRHISSLTSLEELNLFCDFKYYKLIFEQIKRLPIKHLSATPSQEDWGQLCNSGMKLVSLKLILLNKLNNWKLIHKLPLKKLTLSKLPSPFFLLEFTKILAEHPTLQWHSIYFSKENFSEEAPSFDDLKKCEETEEKALIKLADWYRAHNLLDITMFFYFIHYHKYNSVEVNYKIALLLTDDNNPAYKDDKTAIIFLNIASSQGCQEAQEKLGEMRRRLGDEWRDAPDAV